MWIKFSNEIKKFVSSDAMREWWNWGVGRKFLRTYGFLVRCDIPALLAGLSKISSWQATIHNMLRIIPAIVTVDDGYADNYYTEEHFDAINARLTMYESLLNEAPTLFRDHLGLDEGIVLTVLSFL